MDKYKKTIFFVIMICACSYIFFSTGKSLMMRQSLIGELAPDFKLETVFGKNEGSFYDQEIVEHSVIIFFATWCPSCRMALKELDEQMSLMESSGAKIFVVNVGESAKKVLSYLEKNGLDLDVYLDAKSTIARKYHVVGIPTFVVVDKNGIIQNMEHSLPPVEDFNKFFE